MSYNEGICMAPLTILLLVMVLGCLGSAPEKNLTVGPSGGILKADDGAVELSFPEDALDGDTDIEIAETGACPSHEGLVPGTAYDLGPDGLKFQKEVILKISYEPSEIPAGVQEDSLALGRVVGDQWQVVEGSRVDEAGRFVHGNITGFSTYGVLGSPPGDTTGSLRLSPAFAEAAPCRHVAFNLYLPADSRDYRDVISHWHVGGVCGRLYHSEDYYLTDLYHARSIDNNYDDFESSLIHARSYEYPDLWTLEHPEVQAYFVNYGAVEGQTETITVEVFGVKYDGGYESIGRAEATVNITGTTVGFVPQIREVGWQQHLGEKEYFFVEPGDRVLLDIQVKNSPPGKKMMLWETTGKVGSFGGTEETSYWSESGSIWYWANGDALDGEHDKVSVKAYLVENSEEVLLGEVEALVDVYAPTQLYTVWEFHPEVGARTGNLEFWHVNHGLIVGGGFYARCGDEIEVVMRSPGEGKNWKHGEIWLVPGPYPGLGEPWEVPGDAQHLLGAQTGSSEEDAGHVEWRQKMPIQCD